MQDLQRRLCAPSKAMSLTRSESSVRNHNHNHNHKFKVYSAEHWSHCTEKTKHQEKKEKADRFFGVDLNVNSVLEDVTSTSGGREVHVRDAAAGKARSPMVRKRVEGTTTADVDGERRQRRPSRSVTGCRFCHFCGWAGSGRRELAVTHLSQ